MSENIEDYFSEQSVEEFTKEEPRAGSSFIKFEQERTRVRVLPPLKGEVKCFTPIYEHWYTPPGKDRAVYLLCPRRLKGSRCPVCEEADSLMSSGLAPDLEAAKGLYPKQKFLYRAIVRNPDGSNSEPKILKVSWTVHKDLKLLMEETGDFSHPLHGYDLVIRKSKEKGAIYTSYKVAQKPTSKLADTKEEMLIYLKNPVDLTRATTALEYGALKQLVAPAEEGQEILHVENKALSATNLDDFEL